MKKGKKLILSLIIITAALLSAFLTAACGCVFFSDSADDPQWVDDVASVIKPIYIPDTSYQQSCFDSVLKYIPPRFTDQEIICFALKKAKKNSWGFWILETRIVHF